MVVSLKCSYQVCSLDGLVGSESLFDYAIHLLLEASL